MKVRDALIRMLEEKKGCFISGEEIAGSLSCSRTAIWKAVAQLKEEGYQIEAVKNRGYRLSEASDILSKEAVSRYLADPGFSVQVYQEITSTNDVLKQMAVSEHAPSGTVVISDYQTGGKGRLGRSFFSPKGTGLYISMLLRPEGTVTDNLILTAQAAVAVYRAVRKTTGVALGIKWVNDLYCGDRKVTGILSEGQTSLESGRMEFVIVGIGINLYEPENGFPEEIRDRAGSVLGKRSEGKSLDRNLLAAEIIRAFYSLSGEKSLSEEYIQRNIVPEHEIVVIDGQKRRNARALRILEDGRLEIREEDGQINALVYGEVSVRLQQGEKYVER